VSRKSARMRRETDGLITLALVRVQGLFPKGDDDYVSAQHSTRAFNKLKISGPAHDHEERASTVSVNPANRTGLIMFSRL
jgi:hypothetical protein